MGLISRVSSRTYRRNWPHLQDQMAKKKNKKAQQQYESDGDDFPDITKAAAATPAPEPEQQTAPSKKGKKGKNKGGQPPRGAVRVQNDASDDEDDHMAKMAAQMKLEE